MRLVIWMWLAAACRAFVVMPCQTKNDLTVQWGKVKRGKLGTTVGTDLVASSKKKAKASSTIISPDLTKWITNQSNQDDETAREKSKEGPTPSRRERQNNRLAEEQGQQEHIQALVNQLDRLLGTTKSEKQKTVSVKEILTVMQQLTQQQQQASSTTTKQQFFINKSDERQDYRLAWVGSDEAVSHVGTGLHKVPLARLQDVFVSFPNSKRIVLQEVIRILGPFPNIKNTLSGSSRCSVNRNNGVTEWNVSWESMMDGTGKELLAGNNIKTVPLQLHYSDAAVIIAAVCCEDPWMGNGENLLLFLREDELDTRLEELRVA